MRRENQLKSLLFLKQPTSPYHKMATGISDSSGRQVRYLDTIEEEDEEEDSVLLAVRRRGRVSLVKQSTPAQSEESRFTVSGSSDSILVSCPLRTHQTWDPPHSLLPSLQEADYSPAGPDQSQSPSTLLQTPGNQQSERPLLQGGPTAAVISLGESSPSTRETRAEHEPRGQPAPIERKMRKNPRPNRRHWKRSEDSEAPVEPEKRKRVRKPHKNNKMTSPEVPEWLANLMQSIEEATHHELVIE
ncbi:hypothetical protein GJAV_G00093370 [Gymnothorax javanicus]|nr:hypothetical protein GJAV_G00093370 [Gymnothorax javanicus]